LKFGKTCEGLVGYVDSDFAFDLDKAPFGCRIGRLGIAFGVISISCDIRIEINTNIFVWMFRYLVPRIDILVECQILFGWSK
jgi:hypothetical protein